MEQSLFSSSWYRVANLKPRLRSHVKLHRRSFRQQIWYVLQDRTSGRYHRFTPSAYLIISLMDGEKTVQQIWDMACEQLVEDTVTQDEVIRLLSQLHSSNVLFGDVPPDLGEMSSRAKKIETKKRVMSFMNPLSLRFPLFDPDDFLDATFPIVRPFLSWFGLMLFVLVVGYALVQTGVHWNELTKNLVDQILVSESLLLLLVTYPVVKAFHELGHGYAVKRWGGEVHEIGIMFLVFMPVPYVDASESAGFSSKWQRAFVGSAGILVELFLASLAMMVWLQAEEGLLRAFAFNVMLIGGVSTLFFNGNPLLRFDGYYVFSDLLEIPNLGQRSNRYIGYLIQRYLFGVNTVESPVTAKGEAGWFFFYAIASFIYRMVIVVSIVTFIGTQFFVVGVALAIWAIILILLVPLSKQIWYLFTSAVLRQKRGRSLAVTSTVVLAFLTLFVFVPLPYATISEGIVWAPEDSAVHALADGQVVKILAEPSSKISVGQPLFDLEDPLLNADVKVLQAKVKELELSYEAMDFVDPVEARIIAEKLKHVLADLELALEKKSGLLITSQLSGMFFLNNVTDYPGKFVHKGDSLAYVIPDDRAVVRVVVTEDQADLVRQQLNGILIKFADDISSTFSSANLIEVPSFNKSLPSIALSTIGGGKIVVDPSDPQQLAALENLYHLEINLDIPARHQIGGRVFVRFDHGSSALAPRIYRRVRQIFLRLFNV